MTPRLLILTASYGEGHNAAARALACACEAEHGPGSAHVADIFAEVTPRLNAVSRRAYLEDALERLGTTALPKSAGVLAVTQRAFTQGQVGLTDLLLARRAHLALLVSAMDLRFEYFAVRSELRHVLGLDGPEPPKEIQ